MELEVVVIDPERVEKAWNERVGKTVLSSWRYLGSNMRQMIVAVAEACHEPVELTEADVERMYNEICPAGFAHWMELPPELKAAHVVYSNAVRHYTPPSLPTKLARAIEALGPDHPEAVRILKEAADAHG